MAQVQKTLPTMTNVKFGARGLQNMCCPKWCRISSVNSSLPIFFAFYIANACL